MKLAGVARFDCIGSTQEFTCYMAGLTSPGDHTCGWTTSTLHSRLAWRYWFHWGCGASSGTSPVVESSRVCAYRRPPARNTRRTLASQQQDTGESHSSAPPSQPIRSRQAPVTSRYTRYVTMHPIRRGAMPTDRVHRHPQQAQPRTIPPHIPQPSASDAATQLRHAHTGSEREALHHLGSITPVREHYTTSDLV